MSWSGGSSRDAESACGAGYSSISGACEAVTGCDGGGSCPQVVDQSEPKDSAWKCSGVTQKSFKKAMAFCLKGALALEPTTVT
ncbi:unnamed protein product, partial [Amoebophrya sp. A25]|eukprot:GSA25T00008288001.1